MSSTHWIDGRVVDGATRPRQPWARLLAVLALLLVIDSALALGGALTLGGALGPDPTREVGDTPEPITAASLRRNLGEAATEAEASDRSEQRRSLLLIGDSVLAGDVLAKHRPHDWRAHRVADIMRRELAPTADVDIHQIALDGLLPTDALHLLTELDRLDPGGRVELVLEINLRYFSAQYAKQRECTRAAICELDASAAREGTWRSAVAQLDDAAARTRDWLAERVPIARHRERLERPSLADFDELAVVRPDDATEIADDEQQAAVEAEARMREHYRSAKLRSAHAQYRALRRILARLDASGRRATLFVTPLADRFAETAVGQKQLGAHYAKLASIVNELDNPNIALLDLDHPLFVDALFIDHVHLQPDGARLLALNLLHELGLPLRERPFAKQMIHGEDIDRSLVHRVGRGYSEGGATQALFDRPEGVAVDPLGHRVVIADTQNHVLRSLRGNMQFVETIAGKPRKAGDDDGPAKRGARLEQPRNVELLGDAVWFIDGRERERLRVLAGGQVSTPAWTGPQCDAYHGLRARHDAIWLLCDDSRLLRLDPARGEARQLSDVAFNELVSFDLGPQALYAADVEGRIWSRALLEHADGPTLGPWKIVHRNTATELLPNGQGLGFPYRFDDLRLAKVVDLRFVDRYGGLLVADEFPSQVRDKKARARLDREWTERVHLRYFDLEAEQVLPWLTPLVHGEGHVQRNDRVDQFSSFWHQGVMALAQAEGSLVWVERSRSRVLRIADGLLGVAKTGNHHTTMVTIPILTTIAGVARKVEAQLRPDRFLDRRHDPLRRAGPYIGVLFGSSLSSMSDRFGNYSFGRRLEQELQAELGYREGLRFDLFQISWGASTFGDNVNNFANWMSTSVPPDVVLIEAHDFGRGYLRDLDSPEQTAEVFAKLAKLADRYDTLVVFYDQSALEANRRDGMRSTDDATRRVLDDARRLGFVVLSPGDRLFPRLLVHSPWGNQPFGANQHHGATWAIDITAQTVAAMLAPRLAAFLRDRVPARLREQPPEHFDAREHTHDPLRLALSQVELDRSALPQVDAAYVQTSYLDRELSIYVDLAGFGEQLEQRNFNLLAAAIMVTVLDDDVYAELAESLQLQLVEFENYDEYGNGVIASAKPVWRRKFDRAGLRNFLTKYAPRPTESP